MKKLFLLLALLWPALAYGADYYVAKTGSGSTCSQASPCLTINTGISKLAASDRLFIKTGTYDERLNNPPSGTALARTQLIAADGAGTVLVMPTTINGTVILGLTSQSYITFDGINFDATNNVSPDDANTANAISLGASSDHIKFTNFELRNTGVAGGSTGNPGNGFGVAGTNHEFTNCNAHDNGKATDGVWTAGAYAFYFGSGSGHVVDNCTIHHNGGYGVHIYGSPSSTTVKNSTIYANNQVSTISTAEIIVASGSGHRVYNNVIRDGLRGGIQVYTGCSSCLIFNNTITRNQGYGISVQAGTGAVVRNNIIVDNNLANGGAVNLEDVGTATTKSNNLCFGMGGTAGCNVTTNPVFVAPLADNFQIQTTSPAKDAGFDMSASTSVTTDLLGTTRPQGSQWDIGAYEFAAPPSCQTNPHSLVGYWTFNSVATDSSGNGFTATLGSGVTYAVAHTGNGLLLPGTAGATVSDATLLDLCDGFTLAAWVNIPATSADVMFIVKEPTNKYFLGMLNGYCVSGGAALVGGFSQTTAIVACDPTALSTSTNIHVAVTYDGTTVRLYKNAVEVDSVTAGAVLDATTGNLLMCNSGFSELCANGTLLDEVKVYTYARSPVELVSDMGMSRTVKVGSGKTLKIGMQ